MLRWVFIDPVGFELRFDSRISTIKSIELIPRLRKILDPPHLISGKWIEIGPKTARRPISEKSATE